MYWCGRQSLASLSTASRDRMNLKNRVKLFGFLFFTHWRSRDIFWCLDWYCRVHHLLWRSLAHDCWLKKHRSPLDLWVERDWESYRRNRLAKKNSFRNRSEYESLFSGTPRRNDNDSWASTNFTALKSYLSLDLFGLSVLSLFNHCRYVGPFLNEAFTTLKSLSRVISMITV